MNIRNLSLGKRMAMLSTCLILVTIAVGFIGYQNHANLGTMLTDNVKIQFPAIQSLSTARIVLGEIQAKTTKEVYRPSKTGTVRKELNTLFADVNDSLDAISTLNINSNVNLSSKKLIDQVKILQTTTNRVLDLPIRIRISNINAEALLKDYRLTTTMAVSLEEKISQSRDAKEKVHAEELQKSIQTIILVTFLGTLCAALFSRKLVMIMIQQLAFAVENLKDQSASTKESAKNVAQSSHQLSQTSKNHASSLQQASNTMTEISSMAFQTSQRVTESMNLTRNVESKVREGSQSVSDMIKSIQSIKSVMNQVKDGTESIHDVTDVQLQKVCEIIDKISLKTSIINDIVLKTQLLSFNASIEAARAGHHGNSFSVVAEEVGNLAQMSSNTTKEISSLLQDSRDELQKVLKLTNDRVRETNNRVDDGQRVMVSGEEVSEKVQLIIEEVAEDINRITTEVQGISDATNAQKVRVDQISDNVTNLSENTEVNSRSSMNLNELARDLTSESESLHNIATTLDHLVSGDHQKQYRQDPMHMRTMGKNGMDLQPSDNFGDLNRVNPVLEQEISINMEAPSEEIKVSGDDELNRKAS
ncbi:MAG: hypothetical protein CMP10_18995 [Zetaproteobacteria bacterium]|nr:hypothetical protein [Pseudobdellovibrionaceae bacterium]